MAINLDMDMGELIEALMKKGKGKKPAKTEAADAPAGEKKATPASKAANPYKKSLVLTGGVLGVFALVMLGVYMPYNSSLSAKQQKIVELKEKAKELTVVSAESVAVKNDIKANADYYKSVLSQFGEHEDIGNLYSTLSNVATRNRMVVVNVKESAKTLKDEKKFGTLIKRKEISAVLEGRYADYMAFKKALANEPVPLAIKAETIKLAQDKSQAGKIFVQLTLLTHTIDKEPFKKLLANIKQKRANVGSDG